MEFDNIDLGFLDKRKVRVNVTMPASTLTEMSRRDETS